MKEGKVLFLSLTFSFFSLGSKHTVVVVCTERNREKISFFTVSAFGKREGTEKEENPCHKRFSSDPFAIFCLFFSISFLFRVGKWKREMRNDAFLRRNGTRALKRRGKEEGERGKRDSHNFTLFFSLL